MLRLNIDATIMLTYSGGLQKECYIFGTPFILREHGGASVLVGNNVERSHTEFRNTIKNGAITNRPELWDGLTAERIVELFAGEFYFK